MDHGGIRLTGNEINNDKPDNESIKSSFSTGKKRFLVYAVIILAAIGGMIMSRTSQGPKLDPIPVLKISDPNSGGSETPDPKLLMSGSWPDTPGTMPVYRRVPFRVNDKYVNLLLSKFEIVPLKQDGQRGYLAVVDRYMNTLNIDTYGFRYTTYDAYDNRGINLPADKEAEKIALKFLKDKGLLPADRYSITTSVAGTIGRYDPTAGMEVISVTSKNVILRRKLGNYDDLNTVISVELGDNGKVIGVHMLWPKAEPIADYPVISPKEAFDLLKKGYTVSGKFINGEVDEVQMAYLTNPDKDNPASDYLQPVYIFRSGEETVFVPAVRPDYIVDNSNNADTVKHIKRTKSIKQYAMPVPNRIKQLTNGEVSRIFSPEESEFKVLLGDIERLLVESVEVKGSFTGLEAGKSKVDPWAEARSIIERGEAFHLMFEEGIKISTSFEPSTQAERDKYGNYVISTNRLVLVQSGSNSVELVYEDGKNIYMKTINGVITDK